MNIYIYIICMNQSKNMTSFPLMMIFDEKFDDKFDDII